jgi:hypothetical protein
MSIQVVERLSSSDRASLKKGVIEVTGKAMNRTALGIVDALFTLYPNATFEEMKQMLPDTLNPSAPKNYKSLFKPYTNRNYGVIQPGSIRQECQAQDLDIHASHFTEPNEIFRTADGVEVLVAKTWESKDTETGESDIQNLIDHVVKYGVRVVQVEKKEDFNKGDYNLEVINPSLKEAIQKAATKKNMWWVYVLVGLVAAGAAAYFVMKK